MNSIALLFVVFVAVASAADFGLSLSTYAAIEKAASGVVNDLSAAFSSALGNPLSPETVDELDLTKFVGVWYQMASDWIVLNTFEKDAFCATAEYQPMDNGLISVHNYARLYNQTGEVYTIDGVANVRDPEEPGQLNVLFTEEAGGSGKPAPYWVLDLGPENADGMYDWAIVSDSFTSTLFVLARDPKTYYSKYEDDINVELEQLGFTGRKAPIKLYQEDDCIYEQTKL
jgi:lipocalin